MLRATAFMVENVVYRYVWEWTSKGKFTSGLCVISPNEQWTHFLWFSEHNPFRVSLQAYYWNLWAGHDLNYVWWEAVVASNNLAERF